MDRSQSCVASPPPLQHPHARTYTCTPHTEILVHQQQLAAYDGGVGGGGPGGGHAPPLPYDARRVDAWAMGVLMYLLVTGRWGGSWLGLCACVCVCVCA